MPTVLIWRPDATNRFGHAALKTERYNMSFWPNGIIKQELSALKAYCVGVPASLSLHHDYDRFLENSRDPSVQYHLTNITDARLDVVYERFLAYNNIAVERASLSWARNAICEKRLPEIELDKTLYTFAPELLRSRRLGSLDASYADGSLSPFRELESFYQQPQSCVSFCFHLIELAVARTNTVWDVALMALQASAVRNNARSLSPFAEQQSVPLTVPLFESIVVTDYMQEDTSCCIS